MMQRWIVLLWQGEYNFIRGSMHAWKPIGVCIRSSFKWISLLYPFLTISPCIFLPHLLHHTTCTLPWCCRATNLKWLPHSPCRGQDTPGISGHRLVSLLSSATSRSLTIMPHLSHAGPGKHIEASGQPWPLHLLPLHATRLRTTSHSSPPPGRDKEREDAVKYACPNRDMHAPFTPPWLRGKPSRG
jgi:hypothetical protein